jgi:zinc transport system permease protein
MMPAFVDPLFLVPFVNGLVLAAALPALGAYARLRGEWLASLGIGQAAAAGIVLGAFAGLPVALSATAVASVAALAKTLLGRGNGDDTYAVMLLAGWSGALLLAANTAHGDDLSRALLQGQIYFTGLTHLSAIAASAIAVAACLPAVSRALVLGRFFPEHLQGTATGIDSRWHALVFDLLIAVTLAIAASVIGVMAAFALVFVPPWVAFRVAGGWRRTIAWAAVVGVSAHVASFASAVSLDQPYGPVVVTTLLLAGVVRVAARRST